MKNIGLGDQLGLYQYLYFITLLKTFKLYKNLWNVLWYTAVIVGK